MLPAYLTLLQIKPGVFIVIALVSEIFYLPKKLWAGSTLLRRILPS